MQLCLLVTSGLKANKKTTWTFPGTLIPIATTRKASCISWVTYFNFSVLMQFVGLETCRTGNMPRLDILIGFEICLKVRNYKQCSFSYHSGCIRGLWSHISVLLSWEMVIILSRVWKKNIVKVKRAMPNLTLQIKVITLYFSRYYTNDMRRKHFIVCKRTLQKTWNLNVAGRNTFQKF